MEKEWTAILSRWPKKAILGAGNGRISKKDAEELFKVVKDSGEYTEVEKTTRGIHPRYLLMD